MRECHARCVRVGNPANVCVFVCPWGTELCESDGPCLQDCSEDSVSVTDGGRSETGCVGASGACNER